MASARAARASKAALPKLHRQNPARDFAAIGEALEVEEAAGALRIRERLRIDRRQSLEFATEVNDEWKERTMEMWGTLARQRGDYVGRVNTARRVIYAARSVLTVSTA